jgi:hypothetical protein
MERARLVSESDILLRGMIQGIALKKCQYIVQAINSLCSSNPPLSLAADLIARCS